MKAISLAGVQLLNGLSSSAMIFRGILALIIGLFLIISPVISLSMVMQIIGIIFFLNGLFTLFSLGYMKNHRAYAVFYALLMILFGIFAFLQPFAMSTAALWCLAVWMLISGGAQVGAGFFPMPVGASRTLTILSGVLSILIGFVILGHPLIGLAAVGWVLGVCLGCYGIFLIGAGVTLRKLQKPAAASEE